MNSAAEKIIEGRQLQILRRKAKGEKNFTIAQDLGISENTVRQYLKRLYARLGAHSDAEALHNYIAQKHSQLTLI